MQALGLVRILKKNLVEISVNKISECKKRGLGCLGHILKYSMVQTE